MELQLIQSKIYEIRGARVMLDRDLAALYQVTTGNLNKAVKRNIERFPERYMFQLSREEFLKFQNGISSWGGIRTLPYVFTEQGVAMLSAVLRSDIAVRVSINIMDAFVAMRQYLASATLQGGEIEELRERIKALEQGEQETLCAVNDLSEDMRGEIADIYTAIGELSAKPTSGLDPDRRLIGFNVNQGE